MSVQMFQALLVRIDTLNIFKNNTHREITNPLILWGWIMSSFCTFQWCFIMISLIAAALCDVGHLTILVELSHCFCIYNGTCNMVHILQTDQNVFNMYPSVKKQNAYFHEPRRYQCWCRCVNLKYKQRYKQLNWKVEKKPTAPCSLMSILIHFEHHAAGVWNLGLIVTLKHSEAWQSQCGSLTKYVI